jgi:hypothetical protein
MTAASLAIVADELCPFEVIEQHSLTEGTEATEDRNEFLRGLCALCDMRTCC